MSEVTDVLKLHLRASIAIREGRRSEAGDLLREAEQLRRPVRGECDGESFEDLRDLDDLTAPFLEVLTSTGKYYWIGWERIRTAGVQASQVSPGSAVAPGRHGHPGRAGCARLRAGPVCRARTRSPDPEVRLGRRTDWHETPGGPHRRRRPTNASRRRRGQVDPVDWQDLVLADGRGTASAELTCDC